MYKVSQSSVEPYVGMVKEVQRWVCGEGKWRAGKKVRIVDYNYTCSRKIYKIVLKAFFQSLSL